jgi:hypothetical protein
MQPALDHGGESAGDPSLRRKNGSARDDANQICLSESARDDANSICLFEIFAARLLEGLTPQDPSGARRYNIRVSPTSEDDHKQRRHAVYASETTGLLLIALVLLVLTLVRYWHDIHWSLR